MDLLRYFSASPSFATPAASAATRGAQSIPWTQQVEREPLPLDSHVSDIIEVTLRGAVKQIDAALRDPDPELWESARESIRDIIASSAASTWLRDNATRFPECGELLKTLRELDGAMASQPQRAPDLVRAALALSRHCRVDSGADHDVREWGHMNNIPAVLRSAWRSLNSGNLPVAEDRIAQAERLSEELERRRHWFLACRRMRAAVVYGWKHLPEEELVSPVLQRAEDLARQCLQPDLDATEPDRVTGTEADRRIDALVEPRRGRSHTYRAFLLFFGRRFSLIKAAIPTIFDTYVLRHVLCPNPSSFGSTVFFETDVPFSVRMYRRYDFRLRLHTMFYIRICYHLAGDIFGKIKFRTQRHVEKLVL